MRRLIRLLILAVLLGGGGARAQTSWTAIQSGTTNNLWGVCYGGGQFVAVGENGTVLTSPDGLEWRMRRSDTDAWLTSVAYGLGNYIAVGAAGTVLASRDGSIWSRVPSDRITVPSTERLNVVGFETTRPGFVIYGEHNTADQIRLPVRLDWKWTGGSPGAGPWWRAFAIGLDHHVVIGGEAGLIAFVNGTTFGSDPLSLRVPAGVRNVTGVVFDRGAFTAVAAAGAILTSSDAVNWSLQPSGTTANFNGLAAFNHTLIGVGDNGTIVSLDENGRWQRRASPSNELLLAIGATGSGAGGAAAVIVGGRGAALRTTAPTPMPPTITELPHDVTETIGGAASFAVRANGSAPMLYQWFRDGVLLPSETREALTRAPLTPADAGAYTVSIANAAGIVTSRAATLALLPPPAPIVDDSFRADATLDGDPTALLPLPDGAVLVANGRRNQLVKLRKDGSLDPAWADNLFAAADGVSPPGFGALALQSDGRILVGGSFARHNGAARANLIRLNADGSPDSTFVPATESTVRGIATVAVQPDGHLLIANGGMVPVRLLSDGRLDATFRPQPLAPGVTTLPGTPGQLRDYLVWAAAPDAAGRVFVAARADLGASSVQRGLSSSIVFRLDATGAKDDSFTAVRWNGTLAGLRALGDGGAVVIPSVVAPGTFPTSAGFVWRFTADGDPYPNHARPATPAFSGNYLYPDGRVLLAALPNQQGPIRLTALGAVDPSFTGGVGVPRVMAATADGHVLAAGSFSLYDGKMVNRVVRLNAVSNGSINPPLILEVNADKTTVTLGEMITVRAAVRGSASLTYAWSGAAGVYPNDTVRTVSPDFSFSFSSINQSRTLRLTVYNASGEARSLPIDFNLIPDSPSIVSQPTRVSAQTGRDVVLNVSVPPNAGMLEYQWLLNGRDVSPAEWWLKGPSLYLPHVTAADAGSYTLTLRNGPGDTITSAPIVLTIDDSSRFTNLSTRAFLASDTSIIAGFVVAGHVPRTVLVRGIGPGLARLGVAGVLPDPQVQLFDSEGRPRVGSFSDDWHESSISAFNSVGAFPLEPASKDGAFLATLSPGAYTAQLSGKPGQSGVALVEIYEADNVADRMLNLSTRAVVGGSAGPAIAGFSVSGVVPKRVLLRAAGPALAALGVAGALANPRLELRDAQGAAVASNDDWAGGPLASVMNAVGAFAFASGSRDAALLVSLSPGNYTAVVDSADRTAGAVLLEVYEVP